MYIDLIKLVILKRKCKKIESKILKVLFDFFFILKFFFMYFVIGEKLIKLVLLVIVLNLIRGMFMVY